MEVVVVMCLVAAVLDGRAMGDLPSPHASYKILMLLPASSMSHKNVLAPLAEGLAERGHEVVMLSCQRNILHHPNITEIRYDPVRHDKPTTVASKFNYRNNLAGAFAQLKEILPAVARELYKAPSVMQLYHRRKEFDLIILDHMFNEMAYPFVHEVPFITVATPGMDARQSAVLGNVLSPSYVPNLWKGYPLPLSLRHRLENTAWHLFISFYWRWWAVVPRIQEEVSAHFPDLPPLLEIERNQSLTLMNSHFSITTPVPLLPSQVEVGAIHCRPAKPLPQDLEAWIAGAGSAGVIYFSLGSIARGETMPPQYRQAFVEAFRRLPQRMLWKYEGELEGLPDNVRLSSWLPQQDVLGHHNVKVFISHGGLLSLQESVYHNTPLLVLPIFGDQPKNGMFVENSGLGHMLVWEELTADSIVDALTDIVSSPRFKDKVGAMSASLRDQLTTPQERAVFWTEYVIRHRGAPQLRCPGAQLSWVEFLMLDVLGLLLLALLLLLLLARRLLRAVSAALFGSGGKKKKKRD